MMDDAAVGLLMVAGGVLALLTVWRGAQRYSGGSGR